MCIRDSGKAMGVKGIDEMNDAEAADATIAAVKQLSADAVSYTHLSTRALMDAGVPIKAPVAGISCGLITEGDRWMTMLDMQGLEDFHGDMDFKVGGTRKGSTAIQMDIKIDGLTSVSYTHLDVYKRQSYACGRKEP